MLKKAFKSLTDSKMTQKSPTRLAPQTKLILRLAILVEHRLLTDRQTDTDTGPILVLCMHSIAR